MGDEHPWQSDVDVDHPDDASADGSGSPEDGVEVPYGPTLEPVLEERPVPEAPATGDTAIDEAMTELALAQAGSFETRIEAGERAHRLLQGRLGGLGQA